MADYMVKRKIMNSVLCVLLLVVLCFSDLFAVNASAFSSGKENCFSCEGTGECSVCGGDGKLGTRYCGTCSQCDGSGVCVWCEGKKKVTKKQNQENREKFEAQIQAKYGSTGKRDTSNSNGNSGNNSGDNSTGTQNKSYDCSSCGGTGICKACNGRGYSEMLGHYSACSLCKKTVYSSILKMYIGNGECHYCDN